MFKLVYQPADSEEDSPHSIVRDLDPRLNSFKMDNLTSDTRYRVCVHAIQAVPDAASNPTDGQVSPSPRNRRCAEARTLPIGGIPRVANNPPSSEEYDMDNEVTGENGDVEAREAALAAGATLWIWLAVAIATALVIALIILVALLVAKRKNRRNRTPADARQDRSASASMISSPFNAQHQYSPSMNNSNGTSSFKHANNYNEANNYRNGNGTAMTVIPNGVNGYGPNLNNGGTNGGVDYSAYRHMTLRSDAASYEGVGYVHGGNGVHQNGGY